MNPNRSDKVRELPSYLLSKKNIQRKNEKKGSERMEPENKPLFNAPLATLILAGMVLLSGLSSALLYTSASIGNFIHIESGWATWMFSLIALCGMPLALIVDGVMGSLYEKFGTEKTKKVFLFIGKTMEVLLLVFIVHQADEWLKGITCSTWSESIMGYLVFLLLEGIFAIGKKLSSGS